MSIFSPILDFFLLGGASLIIYPAVMLAFPGDMQNASKMLTFVLIAVFYLEYVVNFPHFAYSYQLMYHDFKKKITGKIDQPLQGRYILAGIIVPVALILFFVVCLLQNSTYLLKHAINVMLLTAGWHYAKQGFGILIVTSIYRRIYYSLWERRILLMNAHLMWIYAWVMFNTGSKEKVYLQISVTTLGLPQIFLDIFTVVVIATSLVFFVMITRKYLKESKPLPFNGITAYIASVYLWIILLFGFGYSPPIHPIILLIPFMHSLQYIAIVMKMKHNEVVKQKISLTRFCMFIFVGILIGAAIFDVIPRFLDRTLHYDQQVFGKALFLFMFYIFINIHHYFIDNVIWRREGEEPKNYLFS